MVNELGKQQSRKIGDSCVLQRVMVGVQQRCSGSEKRIVAVKNGIVAMRYCSNAGVCASCSFRNGVQHEGRTPKVSVEYVPLWRGTGRV